MDTVRRSATLVRTLLVAGGLLLTAGREAPAAAAEGEAAHIAVLESDAGFAEKAAACRALVRTGTAAAVPALAKLLEDEKLSDMARYALEPIPDPAVDAALRAALKRVSGRPLVGVIGSLGVRRDRAAVEPIAQRLRDADGDVAQAAARALGQIGSPAAAEALLAALPGSAGENRLAVIEGLLRSAEALQGAGGDADRGRALAIFDNLGALPDSPHQVRAAALRGSVLLRGDGGIPVLMEALRGQDYALAAAAARTAMELPGGAATRALADALAALPEDRQLLALSALGRRADKGAVPAVLALARSGSVPARVAAVRTVGELGDASATAVLAALQRDPEAAVARAARETLAALAGPEVDAALLAQLAEADPAARAAAVELLAQRRTMGAMPALLKAAEDPDEDVRVRAARAVGDLGGADQFQPLIGLLLRAPSPASLRAVEDALGAICVREARPAPGRVTVRKALYGDLPAGPSADVTEKVQALVAAGTFAIEASNGNFGDPAPGIVKSMRLEYSVDGATEVKTVRENETVTITAGAAPAALSEALCAALPQASPAARRALLRVLRSARGPAALAAVRAATEDADPETRSEAVSVLCGWPTPAALEDILTLAEKAPESRTRILALRGAFRLVPLMDAPTEARLAVVKRAFPLAERKEEKLLALTALAGLPSPAALALAVPALENPDLKEEAALAVLTLAENLAALDAATAADGARRVLQAGVRPETAKRAEELLARIGQPKAP